MLSYSFKVGYSQKFGNSEVENEDAYLLPPQPDIAQDHLIKFAVSDGATESSFSKDWADLLVAYFKDYSSDIENLLVKARGSWIEKIQNLDLPWYAQEKMQLGAYASLLGLTIDLESQRLKAIAVGDSNLFIVRNDTLITSFPINTVNEFGNTPYLLASVSSQNQNLESNILQIEGGVEADDLLIVCTDAIAAWILSQASRNKCPWLNLTNLITGDGYSISDFNNWLNNKRFEREIKNDDTTVILIKFK
jgi:hypothetical protein